MATTPIVTEVTLAELNALVEGNLLNEGLQYKVTNKDWSLTASATNKLFAVRVVIVANEYGDFEELPVYIDCNTLILDSGYYPYDLSGSTGTPLQFGNNVPSNYMVDYVKAILGAGVILTSLDIKYDGNSEATLLELNSNRIFKILGWEFHNGLPVQSSISISAEGNQSPWTRFVAVFSNCDI